MARSKPQPPPVNTVTATAGDTFTIPSHGVMGWPDGTASTVGPSDIILTAGEHNFFPNGDAQPIFIDVAEAATAEPTE